LIPVVLKIRGIHDGRGDASSSAGGEQPIEPVVAETPQASRVRKHLTDDAPANLGICPQLALDQSDLARGAHCPQVNPTCGTVSSRTTASGSFALSSSGDSATSAWRASSSVKLVTARELHASPFRLINIGAI
jgi:hypothetical protein